jgi:hypothetical protein
MAQLIKQISHFVMALLLVIAVGGFSLIQHYCNCAEEMKTSIIFESNDCHADVTPESCCKEEIIEIESCCSVVESDHSEKHTCNSNNCCTEDFTFLKTDVFDYSVDHKKSFRFIVAYEVIIESEYSESHQIFHNSTTFFTDLPPPDFGKDLLISLHQIKIANLLV